jgi:hypothetical protein
MEYIIAAYISAWLVQLWTVFLPVMKRLPEDNIVYQWKILSFIVLAAMNFLVVVFLLPAMLDDNIKERFQKGFEKGLLGE